MSSNKLIYLCFSSIIIFLTIGLPTFFTGCNLSVSTFCPNYNLFNGYIYQTKIYKEECLVSRKRVPCWDVYAYASNTMNYNQSTTTCRYLIEESVLDESEAQDDSQKYYTGQHVSWYKRISSNECFSANYVTTLWYVGIIFLSAAGLVGLIGSICWFATSYFEKQTLKYSNCSTDLEMNTI